MKIDELICLLEILKTEPQVIDLADFAYRRGEQYGRMLGAEEAISQMSQLKPKSKPLTASEIVACASEVYQSDPNAVTENDIKFAREIQRIILERL
jgi:hypothetical protein